MDDKKQGGRGVTVDDKLSALRSFRKARGLCIRCGEKWATGHKCAAELQLHALQEVWNLCQDDFQELESSTTTPTEPENQVFMLLSAAAVSGDVAPRTMQLRGFLGDLEVLILINSGSSHSFLSSSVASKVAGCIPLLQPMTVKIADGGTVRCEYEMPEAKWTVQGYSFQSALKVLPLGSFDLIIGMDWLEPFSPMKIHWRNKWMAIPYGSSTALLQGIHPEPVDCALIQLFQLDSD